MKYADTPKCVLKNINGREKHMEIAHMKKDYGIDYARAVATLMIVLTHINQRIIYPEPISLVLQKFSSGVAIFFVISGYTGMKSYQRMSSPKTYYFHRMEKLLPLYWGTIFLNVVIRCFWFKSVQVLDYHWIFYILGIQMFVPSSDFWIWNDMNCYWTMSSFFLFYLFVPIIFRFVNSLRRAILFSVSCRIIGIMSLYILEHILYAQNVVDCPEIFIAWYPLKQLYIFSFGIVYYYIRIEKHDKLGISLLTVLGGIITLLEWNYGFEMIAILTVIMLLVLNFPYFKSWFFFTKFISMLNEYSYSIYLTHFLVLECLYVMTKYVISSSSIIQTMFTILIMILTAYIVHNFFEIPLWRIIDKIKNNVIVER